MLLKNNGDLIRLPGSPFWNVFKSFGRDEIIALFISATVTLIASFFTGSAFILALTGPVVEKIGFYPAHFYSALENYRNTSKNERQKLRVYLKSAFGSGSESLLWDITVHDPLYVLFFIGLSLQAGVPIWLNAIVSFVAAVIVVSWIQVLSIEIRYARFKRKMTNSGFGVDNYIEARFHVRDDVGLESLLKNLKSILTLREIERLEYFDTYFSNTLPRFSGRAPAVRLRKRTFGKSSDRWRNNDKMVAIGFAQTAQVVYTRAREEPTKKLDQFRFFSVEKDKFFMPINELRMPDTLEGIKDANVRKLLGDGLPYKKVNFRRVIFLDKTEALYVAVDAVPNSENTFVLELKVRKEKELFLAAMRKVMLELPAIHTTLQKIEFAFA